MAVLSQDSDPFDVPATSEAAGRVSCPKGFAPILDEPSGPKASDVELRCD